MTSAATAIARAVAPDEFELAARSFCADAPHRDLPFAKRNWGGVLHSLCSYQGKLKPAIAHFLVRDFTAPGERVLDPLAGVGTIPLEARRQGRVAVANDLSPLAATVTAAKVSPVDASRVQRVLDRLCDAVDRGPSLAVLERDCDTSFGLNGAIGGYFHPNTLREVLIARQFFATRDTVNDVANAVVMTSLLHILHGNRPYALSRRSHPVTPFAPSGPFEYRPLIPHLTRRLAAVVPALDALAAMPPGEVHCADFRELQTESVDAVITSPPFSNSLRFWSVNWLRLWLSGWAPEDFKTAPASFLEVEQAKSFLPYAELSRAMHAVLKPGGRLLLHLGATRSVDMAAEIAPHLQRHFEVVHVGAEDVSDTESHGLRDKGATVAHTYLFARRR
jgi:hypothetical protein